MHAAIYVNMDTVNTVMHVYVCTYARMSIFGQLSLVVDVQNDGLFAAETPQKTAEEAVSGASSSSGEEDAYKQLEIALEER